MKLQNVALTTESEQTQTRDAGCVCAPTTCQCLIQFPEQVVLSSRNHLNIPYTLHHTCHIITHVWFQDRKSQTSQFAVTQHQDEKEAKFHENPSIIFYRTNTHNLTWSER